MLTCLFLYPLMSSQHFIARIRRAALRTLVAAGVALTASTINVAVLTAVHGIELSWLCLGSCTLDVTANVLALFWVTDTPAASLSTSSPGTHEAEQRSRPATLLSAKSAFASAPPLYSPMFSPYAPGASAGYASSAHVSAEPGAQAVHCAPVRSCAFPACAHRQHGQKAVAAVRCVGWT